MGDKAISTILLSRITAALMLSTMMVIASVGLAFAHPTENLDWGSKINVGQCDETIKLVIDVSQKVLNDVDSGEAGNNWAFDNYNRQIQVWLQSDGTYCALVRYKGNFDGQENQQSPGTVSSPPGGLLTGEEDGSFEGGYRAIIIGSLKTNPDWSTRGSVGTFNYNCDLITGICPGYENWVEKYFNPGYIFLFDWWGWIYHGGNCGTWVNSVDGNSGDVLCS
ncbi:MAG TPA: hypothetical protein VGQ13_07800 [Nitrososphaera sp.]|jgi:hypothetical protein|nr:hypothetical protein [Nitrososphaera sp.]